MIRIPIEDIDWTVRTYSMLKRNGIDFTDQLYDFSYKNILDIHYKSVEEIEDKMGIESR